MNINTEKIVFEGPSFIIYDISDLLPKHKNYPHGSDVINPNTKKPEVSGAYSQIPNRKIEAIIAHQTAGGYGSYDKQVFNTGSFFVRDPTWVTNPRYGKPKQPEFVWTGEGRGWPGFAYTWFVPFMPLVYKDKWVVYQCNRLDMVTWHTGDGMNTPGGGLAFQGYFLDPDAGITVPMKGTSGEPSEAQLTILSEFWTDYARAVLKSTILTGHWEHKKPTCPGQTIREEVCRLRGY
jgi:hypothetical protein